MLNEINGAYPWLAFIDIDEFIVPKKNRDIKSLLKFAKKNNASAIAINRRIFGSSNQDHKKPGLVMKRFRSGHVPVLNKGCYLYTDGESVPSDSIGRGKHICHRTFQVNHYFTKSRSEWESKRLRGDVSLPLSDPQRIRPQQHFDGHDRNEKRDRSILRFLRRTKRELAYLTRS